jgi:GMP synthase (glutamine-hydrolysing)
VYPGSAKEIGWATVQLAAAALPTPLSELGGVPVLHWHGDTFDLPEGALLLASTTLTPNQAFAWGRHALAMQFHPEVVPERIEEWLIGHGSELAAQGLKPQQLRQATKDVGQEPVQAGARLLRRWLEPAKHQEPLAASRAP